MRKILPLILALLGLLGGGGVGMLLHSNPPAEPIDNGNEAGTNESHATPEDPESAPEYVKMSNQFVVPILEKGRVIAMVILNLSLEVTPGTSEGIYAREPKLRDAFLQILFDHANSGGFNGDFTDGANLTLLRKALKEVARTTIGESVTDVLVTDLARQDS